MRIEKIIEPATTKWAAPIVFATKKDGSLRFCVDYHKLNAVTIRDSYPLPRMDERIDSLGEATVFSTLDASSGYWNIEIDERDRDKTAFTSRIGLYRFTRMPFELENAPATFQRAMDVILASFRWQFALVYLDDIVVFSKSSRVHIDQIRPVLRLLYNAAISRKLKKCKFFAETMDYLGHVIRPGRLEVAEHTTDAVANLEHPTTQTELRSILGLYNVFRRFVPKFARLAAPLNKK